MSLLQALNELYEKGVDYVDIHGLEGTNIDTVGFSFSKDYMNPDLRDNFDSLGYDDEDVFEEYENEEEKGSPLTDDDINQLL